MPVQPLPPQLNPTTISIVKSTVPVLKEHGIAITLAFYNVLFERYPAYRQHFNMDRHSGGILKDHTVPAQVAALANAITAYAKHIDNLKPILPVVETICHKHVSRGVVAHQYKAIGECFLAALKSVLADAATDEIVNSWSNAYDVLADIMITTENRIRVELEDKAGYSGFVPMQVVRVADGDGGKVLSLQRDNGTVPPDGQGQYVSLKIGNGNEQIMTSMKIAKNSHGFSIVVPMSQEVASRYLLEKVGVGSVLEVSVPCGKVRDI